MVKLNKQYERLEATVWKIDAEVDEIEERIAEIKGNPGNYDADCLKPNFQKMVDNYAEQAYELLAEVEAIQKALDYLNDYCEW